MEKVYDSVQQILQQCNTLIEETQGCEFLDIKSLAKSLGDACEELSVVFRDNPGDEDTVRAKKQAAERLYLKLEQFVAIRLHVHGDVVEKRNIASRVYTDCRALTLQLNKDPNVDKDDLLYWATVTQWALKFYARSLHCCFMLDSDDERTLYDMIKKMRIMEDKYNNGRQILSGSWLSEGKA